MRKSVSRALYLLALLLEIVGVAVFIYGASGGSMSTLSALVASGHLFVAADMSNSLLTALGALLVSVGSLLTLIAWIGALIRTAVLGRWGWFIFLLLFNGITLLIYIFAGPTTSARPAFANASSGGPPRY
jgi:hypothetical protein